MIRVYIIIGLILAGLVGGSYWMIQRQDRQIQELKRDIVVQKVYFEKKIKTSIFNAVIKEKKSNLEKTMLRDDRNEVDINSTRFYIN